MNREHSIEIDAPAATVWAVFSDVVHWPDWTASVRRVVPVDEPALVVGAQFTIEQPRLPRLVWEVTEIDPGHGWTWRSTSPGTTTTGWHEVVPLDDGRTRARQGIDQHGLLAPVVGLFTVRLTERYLAMESQGLKARSEQLHANDSAV